MSIERDEVADVFTGHTVGFGGYPKKLMRGHAQEIADRILAAGYRKPRTVTTVEELDALPFGSVILDRSGLSLHKNEFTGWRASNGAKDIDEAMLAQEAFPAIVLHEPAA